MCGRREGVQYHVSMLFHSKKCSTLPPTTPTLARRMRTRATSRRGWMRCRYCISSTSRTTSAPLTHPLPSPTTTCCMCSRRSGAPLARHLRLELAQYLQRYVVLLVAPLHAPLVGRFASPPNPTQWYQMSQTCVHISMLCSILPFAHTQQHATVNNIYDEGRGQL